MLKYFLIPFLCVFGLGLGGLAVMLVAYLVNEASVILDRFKALLGAAAEALKNTKTNEEAPEAYGPRHRHNTNNYNK